MSAGQWTDRTNAIGLLVKAGRYGGTFAHKDIAFHFAMRLSPEFQIYLIREFQRLKEAETERIKNDWSIQRILSKINYKIHTDAIKETLIPQTLTKQQVSFIYANEADLLNVALFGITAKQWKDNYPQADGNMRDHASIEQLVVLSNLESLNAVFIQQGISQAERLVQLNKIAITQMQSLISNRQTRQLK